MNVREKNMILSPSWLLTAVITFAFGFCVLSYLAVRNNSDKAPIPKLVRSVDGGILYTGQDIMQGQYIFQKYGLMQHGTLFGHGAYLGPDFTAQYLRLAGERAHAFYGQQRLPGPDATERVRTDFKANNYDPGTGELSLSAAQASAYRDMIPYYANWFGPPQNQQGLRRPYLKDPEEIRKLTSFFSWAAWVSSAARPGYRYSYTNNWPPDDLAGNKPTPATLMWSVLSLVALLCGAGVIFFVFGRYQWLGWQASETFAAGRYPLPEKVHLTPSQRTVSWYFLVVSLLFLLLGLLGGVNAHYHVEPAGFYGISLGDFLPYHLSRMWHVQLALFFVASSFVAMGIFLTPFISGHEPPHQDKLAFLLLGALVVVVGGAWQVKRLA